MKRTQLNNSLFFFALAYVIGLLSTSNAHGQLPFRLFGSNTVESTPMGAKTQIPDSRRMAEVNVEIAWLADPVTFPYYLEAHVVNSQLEMRGYIPNKMVRDHAMRIAQIYSSLPVTDALKEHSSLLVRPSMMSPQQLQSSAKSSLRAALPKQATQFKIDCGTDGKVSVAGSVNTLEEKLAVSHALRRLQGCTSVHNGTILPTELVQQPTTLPPRERTPIIKTSNPVEVKHERPLVAVEERSAEPVSRWRFWPFFKTAPSRVELPMLEPRVLKEPESVDGPIAIPNFPETKRSTDVIKVESPYGPEIRGTAELQKRILAVCKRAKGADLQFLSAKDLRITVHVRAGRDVGPAAEEILAMPELRNYRPDLLFKLVNQ